MYNFRWRSKSKFLPTRPSTSTPCLRCPCRPCCPERRTCISGCCPSERTWHQTIQPPERLYNDNNGRIPRSSDTRPIWFIAQIVKRCLQHDFVARVNWRQLILGSGLVVQVVSALLRCNWQDFNWHDASRGRSAIAELLALCAMHETSTRHDTGDVLVRFTAFYSVLQTLFTSISCR